ncbi:hypothetical protein [Pedococcus sp. 5OH_020]|uniref:hypothetical protein n=1 Tax=Pedococcus sp. 5OH_020 TaxID=2989814 RepID=UPI0022E9AA26|nr:hypothetical protein [Pedococcus sp. 5OH_020]
MGLFNPGSSSGNVRAKAQRLELLLGLLGFFAFMAMLQLVILEVRGEPAVGPALLLAALLALCWLVWRSRRNLDV